MANEELIALTNRLAEVEERLALYEVNGLADAFSGQGNQTFGGGRMRLSKYGIQMKVPNNLSVPVLMFTPTFQETSSPSMPNVQLKTFIRGTTGYSQAVLSAEHSALLQASLTIQAGQSQSYWELLAGDLTAGAGTPNAVITGWVDDSGEYYVAVSAPLRVAVLAADPATLQDGEIWYNSTSNTFKVRQAGATKTVTVA